MFIAIVHEIHNPTKFQEFAERVFPLPEGLRVHQFFPAPNLSRAACLYEAPSIDQLRVYIDGTLGDASINATSRLQRNTPSGCPAERVERNEHKGGDEDGY